MAEKLERKVMEIYGENAATRDIIAYGSDIAGNIVETKDPDVIQTEAYKTGVRSAVVGNNSTTLQNRQALDFLFSRQLKYLYQNGIAEWGADETYFVNSFAADSNGNLYVSLTDNNKGNNPVTDTKNWKAFPTPAQLAEKVAKAGDTMTGPLKMSGQNEVRFGTDDDFYYIRNTNHGTFEIYGKNGKGLFLDVLLNFAPSYWDGTNAYRLLTTADLANIDYVVESKVNADGSWYRKYKSGWLEQGGQTPTVAAGSTTTVTLLKPYNNVVYNVVVQPVGAYTASGEANNVVPTRTTTNFIIASGQLAVQAFSWRAEGQSGGGPAPKPILHKYAWIAADKTLVYADVKELALATDTVAYLSPYTNDTFSGSSIIQRLGSNKYTFVASTTQDVAYSHEVTE